MILLDGQRKIEALSGPSKPRLNSYKTPLGADHITKSLREITAGDILWDQALSDYLVVQECFLREGPESSELSYLRDSEGAESWTFQGTDSSASELSSGLRHFENIVVLRDSDALLQRRVGALRREHALTYGHSSTGSSSEVEQPPQSSSDPRFPQTDHVFSWKNPLDLKLGEFVLKHAQRDLEGIYLHC